MKFGMIGAGNMVSAIVKGMTKNGYDADKLYLTSKTVTSARRLAESCGGQVCETAQDVIAAADVVVLGVKPHVLAEILPDLKDDFAKKTAARGVDCGRQNVVLSGRTAPAQNADCACHAQYQRKNRRIGNRHLLQ